MARCPCPALIGIPLQANRIRARRATRARADCTEQQYGERVQLKNAKGILRSQSDFTDVEKFVTALEWNTHESNDFLALFPTGLGKATKSRFGVNLKVGSRRVAIGEMSAFPEVLSPVR